MSKPTTIFSCSGASDVGGLTDRVARQMTAEGKGQVRCLAGLAKGVPGIVRHTKEADEILVIDGCKNQCAKHCLMEAGFDQFDHVDVTELGFQKGQTDVTDEVVQEAIEKIGIKP